MEAGRPRSPRRRPVRGPPGDSGAKTSSLVPLDPHPGGRWFLPEPASPTDSSGTSGAARPVSSPESQLPVHARHMQVAVGGRSVMGAHLGVTGERGRGRGKQMLAGVVPTCRASGLRRGSACQAPAPRGPVPLAGRAGPGRLQEVWLGGLLALEEPVVCKRKPMASNEPPDSGAEQRGQQCLGPGKALRAWPGPGRGRGCEGQRQSSRGRAGAVGRAQGARVRCLMGPGQAVAPGSSVQTSSVSWSAPRTGPVRTSLERGRGRYLRPGRHRPWW